MSGYEPGEPYIVYPEYQPMVWQAVIFDILILVGVAAMVWSMVKAAHRGEEVRMP